MGPGAEAEAAFGFERVLPATEFKQTLSRIAATEKVVYAVIPRAQDTTRTRELMLIDDLKKARIHRVRFRLRLHTRRHGPA